MGYLGVVGFVSDFSPWVEKDRDFARDQSMAGRERHMFVLRRGDTGGQWNDGGGS